MTEYKTIAETNRFIVLDCYDKDWKLMETYQSEDSLERELIEDLKNLGYIFEFELTLHSIAKKTRSNSGLKAVTLNRERNFRKCPEYR
jgi:hypothetical protein